MLGIIIVAYKNLDRTIEFVNTQLKKLSPAHIAVIVNNASTMAECQKLAKSINGVACNPDDVVGKHNVYVVNSTENLGFAKGNNMGVRFLIRNNPCEHILFSNDDIIVEENTDLTPMINLLDEDKSIGAVGPDIVGIDDRHQSPHYRKITPYRQIGWFMLPWLRKFKSLSSENNVSSTTAAIPCYWVSGAFFLMRYGNFSAVNGFDPDTFLYSEEPILAEKLLKVGKKMYFYPNIRVLHMEGGTTKNSIGNNQIMQFIIESNCIYYRKYLKTPKIIVSLYRWLAKRQLSAKE